MCDLCADLRCSWKVFSGNELAALLGWWMFFNWKQNGADPAEGRSIYMLATAVSSKILQALARAEGFRFEVRAAHSGESVRARRPGS